MTNLTLLHNNVFFCYSCEFQIYSCELQIYEFIIT